MKKIIKRLLIGIGILIVIVFSMVFIMNKTTKDALSKQKNVAIDMNNVKDGTYEGSSDGGMVKVEVSVEVKNHKIINIDLIKHENGRGKKAEKMIPNMISENTDDVDAVSGATASSKTIRNAVNVALQKGLE